MSKLPDINEHLAQFDLSRQTVMELCPHHAKQFLHDNYNVKSLLSENTKHKKAAKSGGVTTYVEKGFQGAAFTYGGVVNMCPSAVRGAGGCTEPCLFNSGHAAFRPHVNVARGERTRFLYENPQLWVRRYVHESTLHQQNVLKKNVLAVNGDFFIPANRPNTISDVHWEKHIPWMFEDLVHTQFLDYTKNRHRAGQIFDNYVVAFSAHPIRNKPIDVAHMSKDMPVAAIVTPELHTQLLDKRPDVFVDAHASDLWMLDGPGIGLLIPLKPLTNDHPFVYDGLELLNAVDIVIP